MGMTQSELVLRYIETFGSITQWQALADLGVMRLASRVNDLRKQGYPIQTETIEGYNKFGDKTRYARYRMGERA